MFKKTIIHGCEGRGDGHLPYLTRYTLFECSRFQILLHIFHRSDADELHDHPWNFTTIPLWRGYYEETDVITLNETPSDVNDFEIERVRRIERIKPFRIYHRPAEQAHRVVLVPDKQGNEQKAVTLVITGKRFRMWGFYTASGWMNFVRYFNKNKC